MYYPPEFMVDEWIDEAQPECGLNECAVTPRMLARQIYESMSIGTEAVATVNITLTGTDEDGLSVALRNVDDAIKNLCHLIAVKAESCSERQINEIATGFHQEQAERGEFASVPYYPY